MNNWYYKQIYTFIQTSAAEPPNFNNYVHTYDSATSGINIGMLTSGIDFCNGNVVGVNVA